MLDADTTEIDLRDLDFREPPPQLRPEAPVTARAPEEETASSFSWAGFAGGLSALLWIAGAIAVPVGYLGVQGVAELHPALHLGLAAIAFGPAVLIWLGAAAAAEASRARRLAARLDARADQPPAAAQVFVDEARALRNSHLLREEIGALNAAVEDAVARLGAMEHAATRNIAAFETALAAGGEGADRIGALLERERAAIATLNAELRGDTELLARSVSRQIRLIQEAAKIFRTEVGVAEDSMSQGAVNFQEAAMTLSERTAAFRDASEAAEDVAGRLDHTIGAALDALGQATSLNDASRQSAEAAAAAANTAAAAVRDATQRALNDARRAAQAVREEAATMEEQASATLARLRDAAEAARAASEDSQAAADRHAGALEKRLSAIAETAAAARRPAPRAQMYEAELEPVMQSAASEPRRTHAPSGRSPAPVDTGSRFGARFSGTNGWSNLSPEPATFEDDAASEPSLDLDGYSAPHRVRGNPDGALIASALELCHTAGVRVSEALGAEDLEHIAERARFGATARRRAVTEAASSAVQRVSRHLRRSSEARAAAVAFRARPDLAKSARRGQPSDVLNAYLLIDAALA